MYLGHYIFMNQTEYTRATEQKYTANAYLITMRNHQPQEVNRISQKLVKTAAIETVVSNSSNRKILGSYTGSLNEVIFILILISGMLAVVVIYNLTDISTLPKESGNFLLSRCYAFMITKLPCISTEKLLFFLH